MTDDTPVVDIEKAVELAQLLVKWLDAYHTLPPGRKHTLDASILSRGLIALHGQWQQEQRDRKVQDKLDAQHRCESAAYWDEVVAAKDVEIERLEQREKRLREIAERWQEDWRATGDEAYKWRANAVLRELGVEVDG